MYDTGEGVPQDHVEAHMWFNLAASRSTGEDRESAVSTRDRARARMTAEQIAEAQRLAREWDAAHPREHSIHGLFLVQPGRVPVRVRDDGAAGSSTFHVLRRKVAV